MDLLKKAKFCNIEDTARIQGIWSANYTDGFAKIRVISDKVEVSFRGRKDQYQIYKCLGKLVFSSEGWLADIPMWETNTLTWSLDGRTVEWHRSDKEFCKEDRRLATSEEKDDAESKTEHQHQFSRRQSQHWSTRDPRRCLYDNRCIRPYLHPGPCKRRPPSPTQIFSYPKKPRLELSSERPRTRASTLLSPSSTVVPKLEPRSHRRARRWPRCELCLLERDKHSTELYGKLIYIGNTMFVHKLCAKFLPKTSEAFFDDEVDSYFFSGSMPEWLKKTIHDEIRRCRKLRCICKRIGGGMGCFNSNCSKTVHLPCAVKAGFRVSPRFPREWDFYCPNHVPKRLMEINPKRTDLREFLLANQERKSMSMKEDDLCNTDESLDDEEENVEENDKEEEVEQGQNDEEKSPGDSSQPVLNPSDMTQSKQRSDLKWTLGPKKAELMETKQKVKLLGQLVDDLKKQISSLSQDLDKAVRELAKEKSKLASALNCYS
ncbi:hypothetical protein AAMO2058_001182600 [Amorphochlora amoebiformis]